MFQAIEPFDLHCLKKQGPLQRYESEEEDISESEVGGQDNSFSPIQVQRIDSDMSTDGDPDSDTERPDFSHLTPPCQPTNKESRPLSMDTIKRRSDATFVSGSYIYDHEEDMILELPSPDSSPPLQPSTFLQPTAYVPPESRRMSKRQSFRSPSPASYLSDDETDVFVAQQVTYVEPETKPNLILISPTTTESSIDEASSPESPREISRNLSTKTIKREQSDKVSPLRRSSQLFTKHAMPSKRSPLSDCNGGGNTRFVQESGHTMRRGKSLEQMEASATINCLSEVPTVPHPMSTPSRSKSILLQPQTSASEQVPSIRSSTHLRSQSKSLRRPPSLRSLSGFTFPFLQSRPASPRAASTRVEDPHSRSMSCSVYGYNPLPSQQDRSFPGTTSPAPYCSSPALPRERSGSTYSSSNLSGNSMSQPMQRPATRNSAASSIYSTHSFRSNETSDYSPDGHGGLADTSFQQKVSRRKSLSRNAPPENPEKSTGKSFLGIRLGGKRKSVMK